jgi:multidrug resistance protein MdtO
MPFQDLMPFFILFATKEEKVTTTITAVLVLVAITIAIAVAILLYKYTGSRAEFRIPGIALEIFIGMYLFRVLSIGPVGWIIGFICAAAQSLVYLIPSPEETVHQFLWLWVAVASSVVIAWLANILLFPISSFQVLQREFAAGWRAVSSGTEKLITGSPYWTAELLRPFVKRGPTRLLKLLKLSLIETRGLRGRQVQLRRMISGLDKITRLISSYARGRLISAGALALDPRETAILGGIYDNARRFRQEFEAGFIPNCTETASARDPVRDVSPQLLEAECALEDLGHIENRPPEAAQARHKPSLFVADAFSNPRHAQFAIKVTLAGMLGYFFYTASDYYGIHTVFYTPLIIALGSTGATVNKGFLRILGCVVGGALGLICVIWVIPRFETLETFLFIVFCVHALAAWIAVGSERISYVGLQIALAFDLGFLQGYGPPENIDPLRDRFIGIVIGILIVTTVFALLWPESAGLSAREQLADCLRVIARLLHLGRTNSKESSAQREQLELEIATRLSEANSSAEQAAFEALINGSTAAAGPKMRDAIAATEQIYACTLPWLREPVSQEAVPDRGEPRTDPAFIGRLAKTLEVCADRIIDRYHRQIADNDQTPIDYVVESRESRGGTGADRLDNLISAIKELQVLVSALHNPPSTSLALNSAENS